MFPSCIEMYLPLTILSQPTESTCGPTCLHAVYKFYQDFITLEEVISGVETLEDGGTLAVFLGSHALQGIRATIISYDLHFSILPGSVQILSGFKAETQITGDKHDPKLQVVTMLTCTL